MNMLGGTPNLPLRYFVCDGSATEEGGRERDIKPMLHVVCVFTQTLRTSGEPCSEDPLLTRIGDDCYRGALIVEVLRLFGVWTVMGDYLNLKRPNVGVALYLPHLGESAPVTKLLRDTGNESEGCLRCDVSLWCSLSHWPQPHFVSPPAAFWVITDGNRLLHPLSILSPVEVLTCWSARVRGAGMMATNSDV